GDAHAATRPSNGGRSDGARHTARGVWPVRGSFVATPSAEPWRRDRGDDHTHGPRRRPHLRLRSNRDERSASAYLASSASLSREDLANPEALSGSAALYLAGRKSGAQTEHMPWLTSPCSKACAQMRNRPARSSTRRHQAHWCTSPSAPR